MFLTLACRDKQLRIFDGNHAILANHDAVFADLLDECISSTVVRDGEAECGAILVDLEGDEEAEIQPGEETHHDGLLLALDVRKEEIIETNLTSEQAGHVDLVCVQRAVENLHKSQSKKHEHRSADEHQQLGCQTPWR